MDERREQEALHNKEVRGYIIRSLINGYNYSLLLHQITNALMSANMIISSDIRKYLIYLRGKGYIAFTDKSVNSYTVHGQDAIIELTPKGVDLVEGTIHDPGVDI